MGLLVAGCGMGGGVVTPAPGDIADIRRPTSPNTCLAGPAGFTPKPDLPTHRYDVPPELLFTAARDVIMARPRTTALALDTGRLRADHLVRSRLFGFPDIVLAQVLRAPGGQSDLVLYSYSLKGHYDFGVNHGRVAAILAALDPMLSQLRQSPGS